jgi:hypothetical protein
MWCLLDVMPVFIRSTDLRFVGPDLDPVILGVYVLQEFGDELGGTVRVAGSAVDGARP